MALHDYLAFLGIVTLIVVSPGVNLFLLLQTVPVQGRRTGLRIVLGFCAAIMSHATLALIGVGALIATSATLFSFIRLVGALYLIWLGIKACRAALSKAPALRAKETGSGSNAPVKASGFLRGYLTNILNPKPAIFYVAAFPQFLSAAPAHYWSGGLMLAASHALIALGFYGTVVLTLNRAAIWLQRPSLWKALQGLSGMAFFLIGGRLMLARAPA